MNTRGVGPPGPSFQGILSHQRPLRVSCFVRPGVMRALLGPILFVLDVAPENQAWGIGLCLLLVLCFAIGVARPRRWSVALAVLAGLAWLFLGIIGDGIGC
jgi:hypothetical protein